MTTEEQQRVQKVFDMINSAEVIQIDNGPLLNSWLSDEVKGDPDNEVFDFSWHDSEGHLYGINFTEANLLYAHVEDGLILCADSEGEATKLALYHLSRVKSSVDSSQCGWKYYNGHGGEWETDCGEVYDANDLACQSIRHCPHCNRETFVRD